MFCVLFVVFEEQRTHPYNQQLSGTNVRRDHDDLMHVEIEEYKQLLGQLESSSKEDEDDPFQDLSQIQFGTLGQEDVCALRPRFSFGCICFRVGCTQVQIVIFVIDIHVTLTFKHLWVVIRFYFPVTHYYVISSLYLIILLQVSCLFEGHHYYKLIRSIFYYTNS